MEVHVEYWDALTILIEDTVFTVHRSLDIDLHHTSYVWNDRVKTQIDDLTLISIIENE